MVHAQGDPAGIEAARKRSTLVHALRAAKVDGDILADVADACEIKEWTVLHLAGGELTAEEVAQELYLTEDEAAELKVACRSELSRLGVELADGGELPGPLEEESEVGAAPEAQETEVEEAAEVEAPTDDKENSDPAAGDDTEGRDVPFFTVYPSLEPPRERNPTSFLALSAHLTVPLVSCLLASEEQPNEEEAPAPPPSAQQQTLENAPNLHVDSQRELSPVSKAMSDPSTPVREFLATTKTPSTQKTATKAIRPQSAPPKPMMSSDLHNSNVPSYLRPTTSAMVRIGTSNPLRNSFLTWSIPICSEKEEGTRGAREYDEVAPYLGLGAHLILAPSPHCCFKGYLIQRPLP